MLLLLSLILSITLGFLYFFLSFLFLLYFLSFSLFFYISCLSFFSSFFPLPFYCARLWPFILPAVTRFVIFTTQPLLAFCGCPSKTVNWSAGCPATTITLYWLCQASSPEKKWFCFVSYSPWHSHLDKG